MRILLGLVLVLALLWFLLPREPVDLTKRFDPGIIGPDPVAWLAEQEARFDDITPDVEKQIIWATGPGQKSDFAVVYVHGFSATSREIRPVPDMVATALGANLIFTRLAGHGRTGEALAEATVADWVADFDEALAIADKIGDKTIVLATSTGGALAAALLTEGRTVAGLAMVSPNFKLKNPAAFVLTLPAARYWAPLFFGDQRTFETHNEGHATYWTWSYPSTAVFPLGALTKAAGGKDYGSVTTPALFLFSDEDQVVDHTKTAEIAKAWGGPATVVRVELGEEDDPSKHVIAGHILSPSQTEPVAIAINDWVMGLAN